MGQAPEWDWEAQSASGTEDLEWNDDTLSPTGVLCDIQFGLEVPDGLQIHLSVCVARLQVICRAETPEKDSCVGRH